RDGFAPGAKRSIPDGQSGLAHSYTGLLSHARNTVDRGSVFRRIGHGGAQAGSHYRRATRSSRVAESERNRQAIQISGTEPWTEVVGVVGHIRHDKLGVDERPQVYWHYHQRAQPRMALAVRTNQDPKQLAASVIAAIHEVDPDQPVYDIRPMD